MRIEPGLQVRCLVCLLVLCTSAFAQDAEDARPAVALNPIDGILDAFRSHNVVALTEGVGHGNEQGHALLRTLIRDPRFASVVDDIVVEWGNSLYQEVMDRFTRGEDVPFSELRRVWENTTQPHPVWDSPVYLEFFRAVRSRNEVLPAEEHIRVLLGDPPIDWEIDDPRIDLARRRVHPAEVILGQVIDKGRRALVVYGGMHLLRLPSQQDRTVLARADTLVAHLEREGIRVFNIWGAPVDVVARIQSDVATWSPVRMTLIQNTLLGAAPFQRYFPSADTTAMEDQFDAIMIHGPLSTMTYSQLSPELCRDDEYIEMRTNRMQYESREGFVRRYCEPASAD